MGRSGNRKKKSAAKSAPSDSSEEVASESHIVDAKNSVISDRSQAGADPVSVSLGPTSPLPRVEQIAAAFLRRAHELKEEGNRRFQSKDYHGALTQYEQALKLTPPNHPDRAVFHSNRAACLMQIKPIQYDAVVRECNLALDIHPKFSRALFRRARALQALGKLELALRDVQTILQEEPTHQDAIELAKRLRVSIGSQEEAQRDMQGKTSSSANFYAGTSPAALGASVVRGTPSPVVSRGPNLPAKPLVKRKGMKSDQCSSKPFPLDAKQDGVGIVPKQAHCASQPENKEIPTELSCYTVMSKHSALRSFTSDKSEPSQGVFDSNISQKKVTNALKRDFTMCRRLKLVYDHDIRLAYMPIKCNFRELRNIVGKRFPSAKAVLLKYKDSDGDWITITSTEELRLAEAAADAAIVSVKDNSSKTDQTNKLDTVVSEPALLKLQVVEVNNEQEPIIEDEEEDESLDSQALQDIDEIKKETFNNDLKEDDSHMEKVATAIQQASTEKRGGSSESAEDGKEIEIDEWLLDFAHLFRTHIGVDPDAHIDLHELGMEFCSEALEETVTSELFTTRDEASTAVLGGMGRKRQWKGIDDDVEEQKEIHVISDDEEDANADLSMAILDKASKRPPTLVSNAIINSNDELSTDPISSPLSRSPLTFTFPSPTKPDPDSELLPPGKIQRSKSKKKKKRRHTSETEAGNNQSKNAKENTVVKIIADDEEDNLEMRQLSRGPRYFDPPEEFCTNCGNTGHCSNECTNIVRKKACYVCGNLDHEVKDCPQSSCLICQEKGHFSRSCPNKGNENSRIWERRNFCLRCGNMGHDMSICDSEYDPEDLKGIQCYVCKDYGHLCCVDVALSSERTDTCYNCGEAGHTGVGCAKSRRNLDENRKPGNVCFKCGEEGHYARGCSKRYEDDPWDDLGTPISEMQSLTNDFQGFRSVPAAAKGHCGWQNSDAYTTPPAKWPERWNMEQGDRWSTEQVEHKNKRFKRSKYAGEISRNDSPSNWCNKNKKASWRQKAGKSYNSAGCSKRFWRKRWQNH